ncbi:MAG: ArsR/SmtB family transcription factor [Candidatus Hodarchaeota archaeon]
MQIENNNESGRMINLDTLLETLGNPTRRVILSKLAKVPHSASELAHSLGISRQAVHSQLKLLMDNNLVENLDPSETRGGKYRIKSNISLRIDVSPDYYNVKYSTSEIKDKSLNLKIRDLDFPVDYTKIKSPDEKVKFLGEQIRDIDNNIVKLENERMKNLNKKECLILELKNIMDKQYREKLIKTITERRHKEKHIKESINLTEEIFYTLFFNPERYLNRFNIEKLMDDLFFSDMDRTERAQKFVSIRPLLEDLSRLMGFLHEDEDDWFFDF